ncbi:hypothetical protein D3C79_779730 [compost metagenome]
MALPPPRAKTLSQSPCSAQNRSCTSRSHATSGFGCTLSMTHTRRSPSRPRTRSTSPSWAASGNVTKTTLPGHSSAMRAKLPAPKTVETGLWKQAGMGSSLLLLEGAAMLVGWRVSIQSIDCRVLSAEPITDTKCMGLNSRHGLPVARPPGARGKGLDGRRISGGRCPEWRAAGGWRPGRQAPPSQ